MAAARRNTTHTENIFHSGVTNICGDARAATHHLHGLKRLP